MALRAVATLIGAALTVVALTADFLGFGDAGSFGIGQLLLLLAGVAMLLVGLLGRRFFAAYQSGAVILLNIIVLLAIVELAAIVVGKSLFQIRQAEIENLTYYDNQNWSEVYWHEAGLAQAVRYRPYVVWSHAPFNGETVNIDSAGFRRTPGAECNPDTFKVFTCGGSTMIGWGSPDWGTIPAHLQNGLEEIIERPVCVVNLGQDGFVSTQSLVALMLELQSGNVPDAVIFYDGVNETIAAWESGRSSVHVTLANIVDRFEVREAPLVTWIRGTRTYAMAENWVAQLQPTRSNGNQRLLSARGATSDGLAEAVAESYLATYRLVGALAQEYGFEYYFFLQPQPAVSKKNLTDEELRMMANMDPELARLAVEIYDEIEAVTPDLNRLWYIADVFDSGHETIWIDAVGHITPDGNRLVAERMIALIEDQLATDLSFATAP